VRLRAHHHVRGAGGGAPGKILTLRKACDGDTLLAAECFDAFLGRDPDETKRLAGAHIAVEAALWIIGIGRGLDEG